MSIVTFSEPLLQRLTATDRRILRDRILCGFCIQLNKRSRTFLVCTTVHGEPFRLTLGRWPLMSVEEARSAAADVLRSCRKGERPVPPAAKSLSLQQVLPAYAEAKGIKPSSFKRYESMLRTHFLDWQCVPATQLNCGAFREHCQRFAATNGKAVVEVARGLIGAMFKYVNAVHGLALETPFEKLGAAGLLPERAQPRARILQEQDLPKWSGAVQQMPEKQRDYLILLLLTGLRRNEAVDLVKENIDWDNGLIHIPDTKTGNPHSLPVTGYIKPILERRLENLETGQKLFAGISADHVAAMACRLGAPRFMLHDLRKLLATVGEKQRHGDAVLRRILNHKAKKADTLHRHYVSLSVGDISVPLERIQQELMSLCTGGLAAIIDRA